MKQTTGLKAIFSLALAFGLVSAPSFAHGDHKHVCKKDGKTIKVKGKTSDDKKAACEAKGGSWEEVDE